MRARFFLYLRILLLTIPTPPQSVMRQAANETFAKYGLEEPWHRPNYSSKLSMRTVEGCQQKLQEAGYEILRLYVIDTPSIFHDLSEFTDWLIGTASANWSVPFEICTPFFTQVAQRMVELDPSLLNEEGSIFLPQNRIHVIAKKTVDQKSFSKFLSSLITTSSLKE